MSVEYLLTALIICLSPGIGVVYTLSWTLGGGVRGGFWAAIGCTIATVIHLGVAMAGLAAILHTSAVLFQTIKFAGVAYLLWMAFAVLRDRGGLSIRPDGRNAAPKSALQIVRRGILLNILNPKLPLFFVAFIPQFVPAGSAVGLLIELGLGFTAMTFIVFMLYVVIAATGRQYLLQSERMMNWMRRAFAASFALLGLKLASEGTR